MGALIGRWWALLVPVPIWAMYWGGLLAGVWGAGVGDGWQYGAAALLLVSIAFAAAGVLIRVVATFGRRSFRTP